MRLLRSLLAIALVAIPEGAWAQSTLLQAGATAPGRLPMYVGTQAQAIVQDSGPASGGGTGLGVSEMLLVARGTGAAPYVGQGTGPFGSNFCSYDAPTTNATGYHFLCLSPNATGQYGLISYGAGGIAAAQDLKFNVNGTLISVGETASTSVAIKQPVTLATTANITLSGEQTIDGVLTSQTRVLVKDQSTASQNGCYVSSSGTWARCSDANTTGQLVQGTQFHVTQGAANANINFEVTTANPITIGTTNISLGLANTSAGETFLQAGTGAVSRTGQTKMRERVTFQDFGAACDGTTNDLSAVTKAIAYAIPNRAILDGNNQICGVSGNIELAGDVWIENVTFKQLDPNGSTFRRTILYQGSGTPTLINVKCDRNGSPSGTTSTEESACIWIAGLDSNNPVVRPYLENVEVTGDGPGIGLFVGTAFQPKLVNVYIHDMYYSSSVDPCIEQITGLRINGDGSTLTDAEVIAPTITRLGGTIAAGAPSGICSSSGSISPAATLRYYQTDGMAAAGVNGLSIIGGSIDNVGEGIDFSSDTTNQNMWVYGTQLSDIDSYGLKMGHDINESGSVGVRCTGCGLSGSVVYGGSGGQAHNITHQNFTAVNTGSNGYWSTQIVVGISELDGVTGFPPVNYKCVSCRAIDTQDTPTMQYGFRNQTGTSSAFSLIDPYIQGATVSDYLGFVSGIYKFQDGDFSVAGRVFANLGSATSGTIIIDNTSTSFASALDFYAGGALQATVGFYPSSLSPASVSGVHLWNSLNTALVFGTNNTLGATMSGTTQAWSFTKGITSGVAGGTAGSVSLNGSTSGTVVIVPQAAAGSYNFNLPTSAGTAGQALLSGGGGASAQTYGTLGPGAGGTGLASYAIGDLLYASGTTTLAKLADVATDNVLISGGVGVAPSWGKVGNAALTNSSTTVNGQVCTLGSTCTVTAVASSLAIGTTTITSGTTTRVLFNNAGALGEYAVSGTGSVCMTTSCVMTTPNIGTPSSATLTNATGLPISTGVSGLGTGVATFLATPSSANLATAVTGETGSGALVFATSPSLVTPNIGAASGTSVNVTGSLSNTAISGGATVIAAILRNTALNTVNTAVSLEFRPNDADLSARAAAITSTQITSGSTADLRFYTNDGAGQTLGFQIFRGQAIRVGYTVATLPSGLIGGMAYVTDAVSCTFGSTPTGGGSTFCPVIYNGAAWLGG